MTVKVFAGGALLLLAVLTVACGGSGDSGSPGDSGNGNDERLSQEERDFLSSVSTAFTLSRENFDAFERILSQEHATASALLSALSEAGAGTTFDPVIEALEELEPPDRFRADHRLALESMREVAAADADVGQAAQNGDIVAFTLSNLQLDVLQRALALRLSSQYCEAATGDLSNRPRQCQRDVSGGEYGMAVHSIIGQFDADFSPRLEALKGPDAELFALVTFAPVISAEDYSRLDAVAGPAIQDVLDTAEREVRSLDAPAEFQADNGRLLLYFDEMRSAVQAVLDSGEQQDSIRRMEELEKTRVVFCAAARDFTPEFGSIVGVHFELPEPGFCSGLEATHL